jgi:sulfatase modifying factor 1
MRNFMLHKTILALAAFAAFSATALRADPLGSAFTYQGYLTDGSAPAKGSYDLTFALFNAPASGAQVGNTLTNPAVVVSNGLFTALLDFGYAAFNGDARWLQIGVRTNGSTAAYTMLSPRQAVTATPYALQALAAGSAATAANVPATGIVGFLPDSLLPANVARLNANQTFSASNGFSSDITMAGSARLNFSATPRQMLNLGGASFGLGVQPFTLYARTTNDSRAGFAWYQGGVHAGNPMDPGPGGATLMTLTASGLAVNGALSGDGRGLSNVVATGVSNGAITLAMLSPAVAAKLNGGQPALSMEFVTVGNPGNPADTTGYGAVGYVFQIGKCEVSSDEYARFLNAVAATDPYGLYNPTMATNLTRSGSSGSYAYAVVTGRGAKPACGVTFYDALRFCNWLHNGQPAGPQDATTTEDGAYTMIVENYTTGAVIKRNLKAKFWLPSEDEWYKAAYHQPSALAGPAGNYWSYPTRSSAAPAAKLPTADPNSANYASIAGGATDVRSYPSSSSFYGTYDQGGNVWEWNESISGSSRGYRGGSWRSVFPSYLQSTFRNSIDPTYEDVIFGFRVARP